MLIIQNVKNGFVKTSRPKTISLPSVFTDVYATPLLPLPMEPYYVFKEKFNVFNGLIIIIML